MTTAHKIARAVLEAHAGVYYTVAPDAHATRERAVKEAARTVEPILAEFAATVRRECAVNAS